MVLARDILDLELLIVQPLLYPSSGHLVWSDSRMLNFTYLDIILFVAPLTTHGQTSGCPVGTEFVQKTRGKGDWVSGGC